MATEQLKAVGQAIKNSPRFLRKKFTEVPTHHEILDEDWYHAQDPVEAGVSFYVKYLGAAEVQKTHGPGSTDAAVKAIVGSAKQRGKLQKVKITISSKVVRLDDVTSSVLKLDEIPLYRVSYCTVDPYYDKVFCYIARNGVTKKLECHAFLCNKRSKAEAITLTVAQAFNIAYEVWQRSKQEDKENKQQQQQQQQRQEVATSQPNSLPRPQSSKPLPPSTSDNKKGGRANLRRGSATTDDIPTIKGPVSVDDLLGSPLTEPLPQSKPLIPDMKIEMVSTSPATSPAHPSTNPFMSTPRPVSPDVPKGSSPSNGNTLMVQGTMSKTKSLDYLAIEDEFDAEFQQLAEARSNPHLLDIGDLNRSQVSGDVKQYMLGDRAADDLARSKSHDDLLFL